MTLDNSQIEIFPKGNDNFTISKKKEEEFEK